MMSHWLDKTAEILTAETSDLTELARIASYPAKDFYKGSGLTAADNIGQNVDGLEFDFELVRNFSLDEGRLRDRNYDEFKGSLDYKAKRIALSAGLKTLTILYCLYETRRSLHGSSNDREICDNCKALNLPINLPSLRAELAKFKQVITVAKYERRKNQMVRLKWETKTPLCISSRRGRFEISEEGISLMIELAESFDLMEKYLGA